LLFVAFCRSFPVVRFLDTGTRLRYNPVALLSRKSPIHSRELSIMSKLLMAGILGVLLVLLGVMSWMVSPHPTPPPKDPAKRQNTNREAELKQQQDTMRAQMAERAGTKSSAAATRAHMPLAPTSKPSAAGSMDISGNWSRHRKPGEQGLDELAKRHKEREISIPRPIPPQMPRD